MPAESSSAALEGADEEDDVFEVEIILGSRDDKGGEKFCVKWKDHDETTWEPACNLLNVKDELAAAN